MNTQTGKNQLGCFWPPTAVCIDFKFLSSLDVRELKSGLGEMLHYFFSTPAMPPNVDQLFKTILSRPRTPAARHALNGLIKESLAIKKKVIEIDEFDTGERNLFNFGHSFGHALEVATGYSMPHGIAVSFGMRVASVISVELGLAKFSDFSQLRALTALIIDGERPSDIDINIFASALRKDKKNTHSDINVILSKGQGRLVKHQLELTETILDLIRREVS